MLASSTGYYVKEKNSAVPDKPLPKLMYYLQFVSKCVDLAEIKENNRLFDYSSYFLLSQHEINSVLSLCMDLSPDMLTGTVLFPNDAKCGDFDCLEVNARHDSTKRIENVILRNIMCRVNYQMYVRSDWIDRFYTIPISHFEKKLPDVQLKSGLLLGGKYNSVRTCNDKTTYGTFLLSVR